MSAREVAPPVVTLWVDDAAVGCGERTFVVLSVGPKWATLLSPASLDKVEVERRDFDKHAKPVDDKSRWRAIAKRLALNAKAYKRLGLRHSGALVKRARALLLAERAKGNGARRKALAWLDAVASAEVGDDAAPVAAPLAAMAKKPPPPKEAPAIPPKAGTYAEILTAQGYVRAAGGERKGWQAWSRGDDACTVETRSGKWTLTRMGKSQRAGRLTPSLAKVFAEEGARCS